MSGNASLVRVVITNSPISPSGRTSPVSGSMISGRKWSSSMCSPDWASTHSQDTPGPDDLAQPVDVAGLDVPLGLDVAAHGLRPGLGAEDAHPQGELLDVELELLGHVVQVEGMKLGVQQMTVLPKSCMSMSWRWVLLPEMGMTDAPMSSAP